MDRVKEIKHVLHTWQRCCYVEQEHRWYYDEYTIPDKVPTQRERLRAYYYKELAGFYKDWRYVLHVAKELGLPLPDRVNVNRYSKI